MKNDVKIELGKGQFNIDVPQKKKYFFKVRVGGPTSFLGMRAPRQHVGLENQRTHAAEGQMNSKF